jgi:hypothetical protein
MQSRPHTLVRAFPAAAFVAACVAALGGSAQAQITHLEALNMSGANETPPVVTPATGRGDVTVNTSAHIVKWNMSFQNLTSAQTLAHIHGPAAVGVAGPIMFVLALGSPSTGSHSSTAANESDILNSLSYFNVHTVNNGGGEIRDQIVPSPAIGTAFCLGDGSGPACPCANNGAAGHGCDNSSLTGGAILTASGHNSPDNVVLIASNSKPTALHVFFTGSSMVGPFMYGDGLRCVGSLKRLASKNATGGAVAYPEGAELSITARSAALGIPITPGQHRFYFAAYRDPVAFCTANTFNSSNAVDILW